VAAVAVEAAVAVAADNTAVAATDQWPCQPFKSFPNVVHAIKDQPVLLVHLVTQDQMVKTLAMEKMGDQARTEQFCHPKNQQPNLASIVQLDRRVPPVRPVRKVHQARKEPLVVQVVKENVENVVWLVPKVHLVAPETRVQKDPKATMAKSTKSMVQWDRPVVQDPKVRKVHWGQRVRTENQDQKDLQAMLEMQAIQAQMANQEDQDQVVPKVPLDHQAAATIVHLLVPPLDIKIFNTIIDTVAVICLLYDIHRLISNIFNSCK